MYSTTGTSTSGGGIVSGISGPTSSISTSYSYGYGSDDEFIMKRRLTNSGKYSREDFKESYCINEKSLIQLERSRSSLSLFGCLSSYQDSPCQKRSSNSSRNVFTSCYGRHPSDEHLSILDSTSSSIKRRSPEWHHPYYYRSGAESAGEQSDGEGGFITTHHHRPRSAIGWAPSHSSRCGDPNYSNRRYIWDESTHSYIPITTTNQRSRQPAQRYSSAPLNQTITRNKHVSFESGILNRSSTSNSFEENKLKRANVLLNFGNSATTAIGSVERLLETGKITMEINKNIESFIPQQSSSNNNSSIKRLTRTQSTQTDTFIIRASGPPPYLSLSPRTSYRVRMVSQGAQTNGNGTINNLNNNSIKIISKSMSTNINKLPCKSLKNIKKLTKTLSDGEILIEKKRANQTPYIEVDLNEKHDYGHDNEHDLEQKEQLVIKHKLINLKDDDSFHEGIIKKKLEMMKCSTSLESSAGDRTRDLSDDGEFSCNSSSSAGSYSLDFKNGTGVGLFKGFLRGGTYSTGQIVTKKQSSNNKVLIEPEDERIENYENMLLLPVLNQIPLPVVPTDQEEELEPINPILLNLMLQPPSEFCDEQEINVMTTTSQSNSNMIQSFSTSGTSTSTNKKKKRQRKFRAKSEERFHRIDASTQSNLSTSLRDLRSGGGVVGTSKMEGGDEEGLYSAPYDMGLWIYINENEESKVWSKHEPLLRSSSGDSTASERDFIKRYTAITHRLVHRKASGETYRKLEQNSLEINKRLQIHRSNSNEFGFRIHGSRPVVVSAVEENTPAEEAGLEVGDVIISINGVHVLESSHSDVVKLAIGNVLELELSRTKGCIVTQGITTDNTLENQYLIEGKLWKIQKNHQKGEINNAVERHFILTNSCLYWYKINNLTHPLGILPIKKNYTELIELEYQEPFYSFNLKCGNCTELELGSRDYENYEKWIRGIKGVLLLQLEDWNIQGGGGGGAEDEVQDIWLKKSLEYLMGPLNSINNPDCYGILNKYWNRNWIKRICILKHAVLYFYAEEGSPVALSAAHLQGYRINILTSLGGKKYVFELIAPSSNLRHYYLATENEHERKRWLAALEYSIDRWINVKK